MSYITLHYYCGCGYKTDDVLEAECHCDTLMHDVSIQGIMHSATRTDPFQAYVEKHEITKRKRPPEAWKPAAPPPITTGATSTVHAVDFSIMRAKLAHVKRTGK